MDYKRFQQAMASVLTRAGQRFPTTEDKKARTQKRKASYEHRNVTSPYSSFRQQERYSKNRMDEQQRNSHKPGTVRPKHIFGVGIIQEGDDE